MPLRRAFDFWWQLNNTRLFIPSVTLVRIGPASSATYQAFTIAQRIPFPTKPLPTAARGAVQVVRREPGFISAHATGLVTGPSGAAGAVSARGGARGSAVWRACSGPAPALACTSRQRAARPRPLTTPTGGWIFFEHFTNFTATANGTRVDERATHTASFRCAHAAAAGVAQQGGVHALFGRGSRVAHCLETLGGWPTPTPPPLVAPTRLAAGCLKAWSPP